MNPFKNFSIVLFGFKLAGFFEANHTRYTNMSVESLLLHNVRVVSVALKSCAVKTSVDSAVKNFLAIESVEDQVRVFVLRAGHMQKKWRLYF